MSGKYAPGTVAMVTALNRRAPYRAFFDGKTWREVGDGIFCVDSPETVLPLVVLDAKHENAWSHAIHALRVQTSSSLLWDLADQIEAQTKPPKPEVFEHLAFESGGVSRALCGKLWTSDPDAVTVKGKCPDCADLAETGWTA